MSPTFAKATADRSGRLDESGIAPACYFVTGLLAAFVAAIDERCFGYGDF
jgi:hypothetical protein